VTKGFVFSEGSGFPLFWGGLGALGGATSGEAAYAHAWAINVDRMLSWGVKGFLFGLFITAILALMLRYGKAL
jgi:MFS superfamily sulfate permease-like transporter